MSIADVVISLVKHPCMKSFIYSYLAVHLSKINNTITVICDWAQRKGSDQVGTKYTISQNGTYLEFCVQYLLSVSCKILPIKLLIDIQYFTYIALADD